MGTMGEQKFVHMTFGHMTKMDAMPIYDKNPSKIFSETSMPMIFELGIQHQWLRPCKLCSNEDPGLALTYFMARSTLFLMLLYGENA